MLQRKKKDNTLISWKLVQQYIIAATIVLLCKVLTFFIFFVSQCFPFKICMVAYMSAVGILPERVVSACSAYLVNCVYSRVSICIYAWLPIWALCRYICMVAHMSAVGILLEMVPLISLTVCAWMPICSCLEFYLSTFCCKYNG